MDPIALRPYAFVYLDSALIVHPCSNRGEVMDLINRAVKEQRPYMTFQRKSRVGHKDLVWHPCETRYFDPIAKK
jgi:hypothetical protein